MHDYPFSTSAGYKQELKKSTINYISQQTPIIAYFSNQQNYIFQKYILWYIYAYDLWTSYLHIFKVDENNNEKLENK